MKPVQFCMFVNPVLTNIKRFSYILVIVSNSHTYGTNQIFSNPTEYALQLHEPHVIGTSLYNAFLICILLMVLHFNLWVAKRQQHSRNMEFPPSITIVSCPRPVFSQEGYQWKGLKQLRSMRFCDSTSLHNSWSHKSHICKLSEITSGKIAWVQRPFNSKWEAQFNELPPLFGDEVLGQASMCFFYMPYHFKTPHKAARTTRKPKRTILLEQNFSVDIKTWSTVCVTMREPVRRDWCKETLALSPPKEETNRGEVSQMHRLMPIIVHTVNEWISEAVVGIVAFASVSSRSLDKDPSWTPCGRSSYGTCWIWPMHLSKLHVPRKTWKTSKRNYTRDLDTWNCWKTAHRAVWSHWPNQQRILTNCCGISREIEWWKVQNSNSTQILSCVMCIKQFSSLTKAVHGTAWNTFAAGLQLLCSRLGCRDLSNGRTVVAPCFFNFNSRTRAIGKTSGFQNTQDYHCKLAGFQLEKYVTAGHGISNQPSKKRNSPCTADLDCFLHTWVANWLRWSNRLPKSFWNYDSRLYLYEGLRSNTAAAVFC